MHVFGELLTIKVLREDRAELAVRRQRRVLNEATAARERAEQALCEFRDYALAHERALYADLCSRLVLLRDIETAQTEVMALRHRERFLEETRDSSESTRLNEQTQLHQRAKEHQLASRMRQKFTELVENYDNALRLEIESKEDAEMEEVAELRRDRSEWSDDREETV